MPTIFTAIINDRETAAALASKLAFMGVEFTTTVDEPSAIVDPLPITVAASLLADGSLVPTNGRRTPGRIPAISPGTDDPRYDPETVRLAIEHAWCDYCGVTQRQPCQSPKAEPYEGYVHSIRIKTLQGKGAW